MTGAQFDALPYEDGRRLELINGDLTNVPSATRWHHEIMLRIVFPIGSYLDSAGTGGIANTEVEFALSEVYRSRPDVCILLKEKADRLDRERSPIPGDPDIAVEVIAPSERASDSHDKRLAYLRNGTAQVWQIYPTSRSVQVYPGAIGYSLAAVQKITSDLLPGFDLPISALFE
jgi:Uma2 family endonuclease